MCDYLFCGWKKPVTNVLISTSWRHTEANQASGRLLVFNIDQKKVIQSCEIIEPPYREFDPNPRGGFRGLKGISINTDRIAIANASTVFIYDNHWNPLTCLWHPSCAGIHDIVLLENRIWITSSRNDLVVCLDFKGNIIDYIDVRKRKVHKKYPGMNTYPFLAHNQILKGKINFRDPRTHDHAITDRLHINSFAILANGDFLISIGLLRVINASFLHALNNRLKQTCFSNIFDKTYQLYRKIGKKDQNLRLEDKPISKKESSSFIVKLSPTGTETNCLTIDDCTVPSHSIRLLKDQSAIYLNSTTGELIHFSPEDGSVFCTQKIGQMFLRGAVQLDDGSIVVGDNNSIIHYDLINQRVISKILVSVTPAEAIFDIHHLPANFSLPPKSFIDLHENQFPVNQK